MFRTTLRQFQNLKWKTKLSITAVASITTVTSISLGLHWKKPAEKKSHIKNRVFNLTNESSSTNLFTPSWTARKPTTDLNQVGGNEDILNSLSDIVRYLQDPKAFTESGIKAPRGVILSGPPGVGKTMMAEAVAGQAGVPVISISGPEIESPYVGVTENNLRNLFKTAKDNAPCVVYIDEIDAIASKRFSNAEKSYEYHINSKVDQLLSLLSQENPGVIVIGTTNNYALLDPAIVRPGRFDRHINVTLPDCDDRIRILKICTQSKKLASSVDLQDLSNLSSGFSGAKISAWVNEAARCALEEGTKSINASHFEKARNILQNGVMNKSQSNLKMKENTAKHELGHALVGHYLGSKLYKVSTKKNAMVFGVTEFLPENEEQSNLTKQQILDNICILLAGRAAEELFGTVQSGNQDDFRKAKTLVFRMVRDEGMGSSLSGSNDFNDADTILDEQMARAKNILQSHEIEFGKLTKTLMEKEELLGHEFLDVLTGNYLPSNAKKGSFFSMFTGNRSAMMVRRLPEKKEYKERNSIQLPIKLNESNVDNYSFFSAPIEENLKLNIDEIAQAFNIKSTDIKTVSSGGKGFEIYFNPFFERENDIGKILKILRNENLPNSYTNGHTKDNHYSMPKLKIDSKKEFYEFIKKQNEEDQYNNFHNNIHSLSSYRPWGGI